MNFFRIVNAFNGKALTPPGWSKEIGKVMVQFDDNGTEDHLWSQVAAKDGAVKIVNVHTKLWIGLNAAGKVIQGNEESDRFYWRIKPEPNNVEQVRIFNKATNQALTPIGWSKDNGAEITVWSDEGNCHTIDHVWSFLGDKPAAQSPLDIKNSILTPPKSKTSMTANGLEVIFVASFKRTWGDWGSGADSDVSCWEPILPNGFQALGHYAHSSYDEPTTVMLAVRETEKGVLAHPVDYKRIWGDWGSGADHDGSLWEPIPPTGYAALGSVSVGGYDKPPLNKVVCVRNNLVIEAHIKDRIWGDWGSGADQNVTIYQITAPSCTANNEAYISAGSFCGHQSYDWLKSSSVAKALKVKFPQASVVVSHPLPTLKSTDMPEQNLTKKELNLITYLPCILVKDAHYAGKLQKQVEETPFYQLKRYEYYKMVDNTFCSQEGGTGFDISRAVAVGISQTESTSMTDTIGISFTASSGDPLGIGVKLSVTASYSFSYQTTSATTRSTLTTTTQHYVVPANGAAALYTLFEEYVLLRGNDEFEIMRWGAHLGGCRKVAFPAV
jgi:Vacuolar protein sorting-associated protein 62/Insecticidal Crystal Toxin, P42/Ricin-type beta-trefoil lectin domain-like